MKFKNSTATIFVPDAVSVGEALRRVTHLGIGAHQDDLEFMALDGILACFQSGEKWFGGVTCTDGAGSSRTGPYADFTDEQLRAVRRGEQNRAAVIGQYAAMIQLDYPSAAAKSGGDSSLQNDLARILDATRPEVVYTHNPADKHDTHIGVFAAAIGAMRAMPRGRRPKKVFGCEGWRGLDWMPDADKVLLDVSGHEHLAAALGGVFDSQIAGGKRYDLAVAGRHLANATFQNAHASDRAKRIAIAMDLTPLVEDETRDIAGFVCGFIEKFQHDVRQKLAGHFDAETRRRGGKKRV